MLVLLYPSIAVECGLSSQPKRESSWITLRWCQAMRCTHTRRHACTHACTTPPPTHQTPASSHGPSCSAPARPVCVCVWGGGGKQQQHASTQAKRRPIVLTPGLRLLPPRRLVSSADGTSSCHLAQVHQPACKYEVCKHWWVILPSKLLCLPGWTHTQGASVRLCPV